jgi:two-component system chemotaxis sensor kinase CheA
MTDEQRLFLDDANDIVERLYSDLEQLRAARIEGKRRRQLAAQIFRRVHTLKGSAASFGFTSVTEVAHHFEAVLDGTRLGRLNLADEVLDAFEDAVSSIDRGLRAPNDKSLHEQNQIVQRLARFAEAGKRHGSIASGLRLALPPDIAASLSEYDLQHAREAIREGAKLFVISAAFDIDTFDRSFRDLTKLLGQSGEVIATTPGSPANDNEISFRLVYAADFVSGEVVRQASLLARIEHSEIKIKLSQSPPTTATEPAPAPTTNEADHSTVRVDLPLLDDLITNAGELFRRATNVLTQTVGSSAPPNNERAVGDLRMRFVAFEERLIRLRLRPASELLQRAAAGAGRMAARHLGKEVEFLIEETDVGIEKSLADIIGDPLLHLVRNAITHGIETPDERRAAGKDPTGRVSLAASNRSGRIHILVSDDGRGIDLDRVIAAAAEQGISSSGLSEDQCLRLIFRPGFSTLREVSDLAGRGIGLDVVDRAMDVAGGEVRVATEQGKGTTFAMIIPAALSLVNCLIVRCGDQIYAIDSTNVRSARRTIAASDALDAQSLLLVKLSDLIDQSTSTADPTEFVVWQRPALSPGNGNGVPGYRIAVDEIITTQETLVRGLGRHAYRWMGVCGAAEIFDGSVALVLDLAELIENALETKSQ